MHIRNSLAIPQWYPTRSAASRPRSIREAQSARGALVESRRERKGGYLAREREEVNCDRAATASCQRVRLEMLKL